MKQDMFTNLYFENYVDAIYFEPAYTNMALPHDRVLEQKLMRQFSNINQGVDYLVSESGILLPVNEHKGLLEPYNYFNYAYFQDEDHTIVNCPIVEVW